MIRLIDGSRAVQRHAAVLHDVVLTGARRRVNSASGTQSSNVRLSGVSRRLQRDRKIRDVGQRACTRAVVGGRFVRLTGNGDHPTARKRAAYGYERMVPRFLNGNGLP
jgi:hypothetical protein